MNLYDYQEKVIECCLKEKEHSQLVSMPTGTGKTITFLSLAKKLDKKTLIIVHREELLNQTYEKAKLCGFKEEEIFLVNSEKKEKFGKLNIAMVQSLNRNLEKYKSEDIETIIIDEAHHSTANSYLNILSYFKIFENKKLLFGFTATPLRGDKDHLENIFKSHSFKMTLSEATRLGYIVPVHGIRIEMQKSLNEIEMNKGDYDIEQLEKVMNCENVNNLIVEKCKHLKKTPTIIFTTSVNHAETLSKKLRESGRKAISVSYKTPKRTLEIIYKMLKKGSIDFITNAVKLSEGFDFPSIKGVILARPTRSPVLYKQMIGRGLRNYPNKFDCFVMEFTSNDPKMMRWEDIDENATFQSTSEKNRKTEKEARDYFNSIFIKSPNVHILDVRISPFEFYECKIRRHIKYKDYIFTPFEQGFAFFEIVPNYLSGYTLLYDLASTMLFWKEKYKSFYVWDQPNTRINTYRKKNGDLAYASDTKENIISVGPEYFGKIQRFGKWYPSDLQPVSREQSLLLKKFGLDPKIKRSARKAEMEIEEKSIKIAIDKYLSKHNFSGIMEI